MSRIPQKFEIALRAMRLTPQTPGWQIIEGPTPIAESEDAHAKLRKLMHNFYAHGRGAGNWTWTSSTPPSASDFAAGEIGNGLNLLKGTVRNGACGMYAGAYINLARNVLGIADVNTAKIAPFVGRGYLTKPGTMVIDDAWQGNVRSEAQPFAALRCFKFSEHHFAQYQGRYYDPTTNTTFANPTDLKWCEYELENDPAVINKFQKLRVFRITNKYTPACPYRYIVEIGQDPGRAGWPTCLLTDKAEFSLASTRLIMGGASRI